jgi:signal transduction histidine kinase/CHASE3 domain sensor protein
MKKFTLETRVVTGFAATLVLLLLAGGQLYRSLMEYRDTSRLVAHTNLVLDAIDEVRFGMGQLVSSQRNDLLIGKETDVAENEREEARIRSLLARIGQLTADTPRQQSRGSVLAQLVEERLTLMNANTLLFRSQGFDAVRDRIKTGSAGISMAALFTQCSAMKEEELKRLKQRSAMAESNATQALTVGALLVALTLTGLPLLWWRVRRTAAERQANESLLQESQLLKQLSDNLVRDDKISTAYGEILTLINQEWSGVTELTHAALTNLDRHVALMSWVGYLVQETGLVPVASLGVPLPAIAGGIVHEVFERNEVRDLRDIPAGSFLSISTGSGSIAPREIIAVPLSVNQEVVAVLELASLHGFEDTDLRIINLIAPQLAVGISTIRSNLKLKRLSDEVQLSNEELQTMNEELQTQQHELAEGNRKLSEVSRTKSEFLANMSHELRTPLNSVIGFSEVLQDQIFGPINEKQQEYVNNILTSGRHLLSLINDVLDLSKVESGKMALELNAFSLRETLEASLIMLREKAVKDDIKLHLVLEPQTDLGIVADQRKLKQILFNLLSNAVKFTPAGGTVDVMTRKDGDFIEITVADSGRGIRKEDIPKLFHAFTQLESVYTKEYEGTGLGLALTRQLVELHGGRIWVKSEFGSGSRFSFTIPLTQADIKAASVNRSDTVPGNGATVLLIEDEPLTLAAMANTLHGKGYRVLRAGDGRQGFEMARHEVPDMIVLDLIMPGMNGFDIADRMKDEAAAAKIPILVLTSMDLSIAERGRLEGKVWRIAEKGSLSTQEFISLVESAVADKTTVIRGDHDGAHDTDR